MGKSTNSKRCKLEQAVLLKDTVITGEVCLPHGLCLFGKIRGNVTAKGRVKVMRGALIEGNLHCPEVYVEGVVEGDVKTIFLVIGENAVLKGKVEASRLWLKGVAYEMNQLRLDRK